MYNDQLVYKVVIWAFFGISLWTEKESLNDNNNPIWFYFALLFLIQMTFSIYQEMGTLIIWFFLKLCTNIILL